MTPFIAEFIGTCILIVFGAGVVSNVSLKHTLGENNQLQNESSELKIINKCISKRKF